jgi:hypothetical protein
MDDTVDEDCNDATDDDIWRDGRQRGRDVDGDGATSDNADNDGDLGLGARLLPPLSLTAPRPVEG